LRHLPDLGGRRRILRVVLVGREELPYWALDGSLTACARASSWAAFLGVSQTRACTSRPAGTAAVCGATDVHAGFDPGRNLSDRAERAVRPGRGPAVTTSVAIRIAPAIATTTRPRRIDGMCNSPCDVLTPALRIPAARS